MCKALNPETEKRYISIGLSYRGWFLVLIHTERQGRIRIISCRKATARERRSYEEG
ncbi:MAG: BrnT family toxin [Syntrophobacterales bacterium]|nr:BrnT family toxin [Syntrophobacterales bacterium]